MLNPFDSAEDLALEGDLATDSGDAMLHGDGFEDGNLGDGFEASDGFEDDGMDAMGDGAPQGGAHAFAYGDGSDGADGYDSGDAYADAAEAGDYGDYADGDGGDMDLWSAFEEEVADGLDAADEDEFIGRLLGGLGRVGGMLMRRAGGVQGIARTAGTVARGARRVGQIAGQAGRVASRISPAASAAARLARLLGAPGLASGLDTVSRGPAARPSSDGAPVALPGAWAVRRPVSGRPSKVLARRQAAVRPCLHSSAS
ncbi:hypothetical protein OU995_15230 [Roseateles sp. SL47]|uniref:hypothetical protein n=1 Tax=Roseateles sp. SL47 TaxID=2995138 RepID=UPI00226E85C7|nr:hypothetical protein [Roseateles sp. SL47]WAC70962.1 hypothetical protein OU995_15230 [Roseateles sp. SL47]